MNYHKVDCCENGYCPVSTKICVGKEATEHRGGLRYSQEIVNCIGGTLERSMHNVEHKCHHVHRESKVSHSLCHFIPCKQGGLKGEHWTCMNLKENKKASELRLPKMKKAATQPPVLDMVSSESGFPWMLTGVAPPVVYPPPRAVRLSSDSRKYIPSLFLR